MTEVLQHLVLLKLRSDMSTEEFEALRENAKGMVGKIEGVLWVDVGKQEVMYPGYNDRSAGYTHMLVVTLASRKALEAYDTHPEHVRVKTNHIVPLLNKSDEKPILALDWMANTNPLFTKPNWNIGMISALVAIGGIVVMRSML